MARALRPLSSYRKRVVKKIWKITPYDTTMVYSTRKSSPMRLTILENGCKEVFATKIEREHPGNYCIDGQWLVLETSPRATEEHRRLVAEENANETARLAAVAKARQLSKELGTPRSVQPQTPRVQGPG